MGIIRNNHKFFTHAIRFSISKFRCCYIINSSTYVCINSICIFIKRFYNRSCSIYTSSIYCWQDSDEELIHPDLKKTTTTERVEDAISTMYPGIAEATTVRMITEEMSSPTTTTTTTT